MKWYCYVLECADGAFYVGITNDLQDRLKEHNAGEVIFTTKRLPVKVVWFEEHCDQGSARRRERQLKKWRREKKKWLVGGFPRQSSG